MFLEHLSLVEFKNFESQSLSFHPKLNFILGCNGVGKTNILDAIHHLCFCKSHLLFKSLDNVRMGSDFFVIEGNFVGSEDKDRLIFSFKKGKGKVLKCNGKPYPRMLDHIGKFPVVVISPGDHTIITGGSALRRRWMDMVISQTDAKYLQNISSYARILMQRNASLKQGVVEPSLYQGYDQQLSLYAVAIYQCRKSFMTFIATRLSEYLEIFLPSGFVEVNYLTQMTEQESLEQLLNRFFQKDMMLQRTTCGTHRDDLAFMMSGRALKNYASQGQQKAFIVALRLSEYAWITEHKNQKPLLLLDDIFDKLDAKRIETLFSWVTGNAFGQVFVTHTDEESLRPFLSPEIDHKRITL